MEDDSVFPDWIENDYAEIYANLSATSAKSIKRFRTEYQRFQKRLKPLPDQVEMYEIYTTSADDLRPFFQNAFSALAHCCEYLVGYWMYQHAYKLSGYAEGLKHSLEGGNWLVAASCLRSIFEEIAHFDYFHSRLEKIVHKISQLEKNEGKRIRQGKQPSEKWIKDYIECDLNLIRSLEKALQGSDFDWSAWLSQKLDEGQKLDVNTEEALRSKSRKTHVNDCIENMEVVHKKPFKHHYDILCDMVHPNFGSNTLVVVSRQKFNELFGRVWLSSKSAKQEAACWFFEIASEPMADVLSIGSQNLSSALDIFSSYQRRAYADKSMQANFNKGDLANKTFH
jgi:hypothetical protein